MLTTFISIIIWLLAVEFINFSLLPLWCRVFKREPAKLLGISRILSLFMFSWVSWILSEFAAVPYTASLQLLLLAIFIIFGHFTLRMEWPSWRFFLFNFRISSYRSYIVCLCLYLAYRFYNSEITWGEKPLEYSLFNYFSRESSMPAEHPWAAGQNMSYYYLGFYALGILQKISALDPAIAFNLSLAFIASSLFCAYQSIFTLFGIKSIQSVLFSALIVFGASLNPVFLVLNTNAQINFDLFWLTSRNFTSPAFAEYPIWSLLFADLHAHVIAMPLVISILSTTWIALKDKSYPAFAFTGFFWGLLYSINGWDFVTVAICLAIIVSFYTLNKFKLECFKSLIFAALSIGLGALISFLPFRAAQRQIYSSGWGWVTTGEFNNTLHFLLHYGVFIGIAALCCIGVIILKNQTRFRINLSLLLSLLLPIAIVLFSYSHSDAGHAWHAALLSCLLIGLAYLTYITNFEDQDLRFACCLIIAAATLLTLIENIYLIDRMNSIFKGYQTIWPLLGIASGIYLANLHSRMGTSQRGYKYGIAYGFYSLSFIFISISAAGSIIDLTAMLNTKRSSNLNFSLVGTSYLENDDLDEAYLIRWIQQNVRGKAYLVEAFGPSYQDYGRVCMHTGLPSLMGWDHHTKQGGVPEKEVKNRVEDVNEIYSSASADRASAILRYYGIDFVFVGKLEKQLYSEIGLNKFAENPEYFIPVAASGRYVLYLSRFSPLSSFKNDRKLQEHQNF